MALGQPSATLQRSAATHPTNDTMDNERTHYATVAEALADGWRRTRASDKDVSGGNWMGYDYISENGKRSRTITFSQEQNKMGSLGCCMEMIKD